jgi:hypothetical protein
MSQYGSRVGNDLVSVMWRMYANHTPEGLLALLGRPGFRRADFTPRGVWCCHAASPSVSCV